MQASSNSRYPRASHESYHLELEEHRTPPSGRRTANKRQSMPTIVQSDTSPDRSSASQGMFRAGNERLYEAYNDLHSLAQDFEKPFDAPAILVVGHQTDGKSGEPSLRSAYHHTIKLAGLFLYKCPECTQHVAYLLLQHWWRPSWASSSTTLAEAPKPDGQSHCT